MEHPFDTEAFCSGRPYTGATNVRVSLYIYHGDTISVVASKKNFRPKKWPININNQICRSALQYLVDIGNITDAMIARYITEKRFRVFQYTYGKNFEYSRMNIFLHAERIGMLPLPVASISTDPIAKWIQRKKKM